MLKYVMFRRISPSSEKPLNNEVVLRFLSIPAVRRA